MKLADIINVIDENQLVKVIFRVYNAEATICGYPTKFKEVAVLHALGRHAKYNLTGLYMLQ